MIKMANTPSALTTYVNSYDEVNTVHFSNSAATDPMPSLEDDSQFVSDVSEMYESHLSAAKTVSDEDASAESTLVGSTNGDNNDRDAIYGDSVSDKNIVKDEFIKSEEVLVGQEVTVHDQLNSTVSCEEAQPAINENYMEQCPHLSNPDQVKADGSYTEQNKSSLQEIQSLHEIVSCGESIIATTVVSNSDMNMSDEPNDCKRVRDAIDSKEYPENNAKRVKISEETEINGEQEFSPSNADCQSKRNRLDSIDIYSHAFDFDDMGLDLGQTNAVEVLMRLPALENGAKNGTIRKSSICSISARKESMCDDTVNTNNVVAYVRGRGYSLDFFSFGTSDKDSCESELAAVTCNANQNQIIRCSAPLPDEIVSGDINDQAIIQAFDDRRLRGDSIIFDPTSFNDGGIHEENALQSAGRLTVTSEIDEIEIMNAPGFVEPPPEYDMGGSAGSSGLSVENTVKQCLPKKQSQDLQTSSSTVGLNGSLKMGTMVQSNGAIKFTSYDNGNHIHNKPNNNNHVLTIVPTTPSGNSSCTLQIELLNQGGRIGMYLPMDRKARIAKFHSKRHLRIWRKRIKYDCRKKLADSRPRIKGRFVKRSDME